MKRADLTKLFKDTDINLDFGDGYINFFLDNGSNCEFYGDANKGNGYDYLTARYSLSDNSPDWEYSLAEDFFFELPEEGTSLVIVVSQILDIGRIKKKHIKERSK